MNKINIFRAIGIIFLILVIVIGLLSFFEKITSSSDLSLFCLGLLVVSSTSFIISEHYHYLKIGPMKNPKIFLFCLLPIILILSIVWLISNEWIYSNFSGSTMHSLIIWFYALFLVLGMSSIIIIRKVIN